MARLSNPILKVIRKLEGRAQTGDRVRIITGQKKGRYGTISNYDGDGLYLIDIDRSDKAWYYTFDEFIVTGHDPEWK